MLHPPSQDLREAPLKPVVPRIRNAHREATRRFDEATEFARARQRRSYDQSYSSSRATTPSLLTITRNPTSSLRVPEGNARR